MKYENFHRAKEIVEKIDLFKKILSDLNTDNIAVLIMDGNYKILTIGCWDSCLNMCKDLAANFKNSIVAFYEAKIHELNLELESL